MAFATAIIEQSAATGGDKVRVEFEGDEVFWALQENYTFEMLLMDAARYWDVSPDDAVLADERGAIWPDDAYVALELVTAPSARIALRIKATATVDDDEAEYYGGDDDGSELSEEEEQDFMAIAVAAEDELLLAQARGGVATLTPKQKVALKRKMKRELVTLSASPASPPPPPPSPSPSNQGYFVFYAALFIYVLYARRQVRSSGDMPPPTHTDEHMKAAAWGAQSLAWLQPLPPCGHSLSANGGRWRTASSCSNPSRPPSSTRSADTLHR